MPIQSASARQLDLRAPSSLGLFTRHEATVERPDVEEVRLHIHPELTTCDVPARHLDRFLGSNGYGDVRVAARRRRLVLSALEVDDCTVSTDATRRLLEAARLLIDEMTRRPPSPSQQLTLPFLPSATLPAASSRTALPRAAMRPAA